jgi:hypothetical protein
MLPASCFEAMDRVLDQVLPGVELELLELVEEAVASAILVLCGQGQASARACVADLRQVHAGLTAAGGLLPIETPALRRRQQALERLGEAVGAKTLALLLAAHRNASLAAVAVLLEVQSQPELADAIRREAGRSRPCTLIELRERELLHRTMQFAIQRRGGGGLWRQTQEELELEGIRLPKHALVGAMQSLSLDPAGPPSENEVTRRAQGQGLFDEGFGTRGPAECVPEAMTLLVLSRLLAGPGWRVTQSPTRWASPIVPGMHAPVGGLRGAPLAEGG